MSEENQDGFCGHCGAKNPLKNKFCFKCGESLLWATDPDPVADAPAKIIPPVPVAVKHISQPEVIRQSNPRQGILIMIGILVVMLILAVSAYNTPGNETAAPIQSVKEQVIAQQKAEAARHPEPTAAQIKAQADQKKKRDHDQELAQIAQRKAEAKQREEIKKEDAKFGGVLRVVNMQYGSGFVSYAGTKNNGDTVIIQVDDSWHSMNKQVRLENTQFLGNAWGSIHKEIKKPRISIVDNQMNEVGGFSLWSGFWVQD